MEQAVIWILGIIAFIILEAVTYQLVSIFGYEFLCSNGCVYRGIIYLYTVFKTVVDEVLQTEKC